MGKPEKLLAQLNQCRKTFPWNEMVTILSHLGYVKKEMAGSRIRFYNPETKALLLLHRPHPGNELKGGALRSILLHLEQEGVL